MGSFLKRHWLKFLLSSVMTAIIVWGLSKQDIRIIPNRADFAMVKGRGLVAYFLFLACMTYFRITRWRFLLRSFAEVSRRRIFIVSAIGFAAILLLPLRIGEVFRPMMIREKGRISAAAAMGTVLAERIVDGLILSILLAVSLLVVPSLPVVPARVVGMESVPMSVVRTGAATMLIIFMTAFATIAIFYFARFTARKITIKVFSLVSVSFAKKLAESAEKLADGLQFLGRKKDSVPFLGETLLYWLMNATGMWVLGWACGVVHDDGNVITLAESFAMMGMLGAAVLIPGSAGMFGTFQGGLFAGMTMYFPQSIILKNGSVYAFLLYATQFLWTVVLGLVALLDRSARRSLKKADDAVVLESDSS